MSAATAFSTDTAIIHVRLLNEGVEVWRPVKARRLGQATYQIADDTPPEGETWAFQPGDIVVVEPRSGDGDEALIAVARATEFDQPSWLHRRLAG